MLEKVMELHFLLYAMMLMGGLGALGMLTTHLTYRRMIRKNTEVKSNLKGIRHFSVSLFLDWLFSCIPKMHDGTECRWHIFMWLRSFRQHCFC